MNKKIKEAKALITALRNMFIRSTINGVNMDEGFDAIEELIRFAEEDYKCNCHKT